MQRSIRRCGPQCRHASRSAPGARYKRARRRSDRIHHAGGPGHLDAIRVVELEVDQAALVHRIVNRAEEAKAAGQPVRKDDDPEVFKTRLESYNRDTAIVAPYYKGTGKLKKIDGMQQIDAVTAAINAVLGA